MERGDYDNREEEDYQGKVPGGEDNTDNHHGLTEGFFKGMPQHPRTIGCRRCTDIGFMPKMEAILMGGFLTTDIDSIGGETFQ